MLTKSHPVEAKKLLALGQEAVNKRWKFYEQMAEMTVVDTVNTEKKEETTN